MYNSLFHDSLPKWSVNKDNMIIFFSEEILDSDVGLWVSGDGLLLAYSSFNDTSVREHTVNGFSPNTKVREHLQHIVVDISVKAGGPRLQP